MHLNKSVSSLFLVSCFLFLLTAIFPSPAVAVIKKSGDIELIVDEPLFPDSIIWYPGLTVSKGLQVKNRGSQTKTVQIEATSETWTLNLPTILSFDVFEGATNRYGDNPDKTMKNFFDEGTVSLLDVPVDDNGKAFSIVVSMPVSAGNEYQGGKATFDLRVGFPGDPESSVTVSSGGSSSPIATPTPVLVLGVIAPGEETQVLGEDTSPTPTQPVKAGGPSTNDGGQVAGVSSQNWWNYWWIILGLLSTGSLILFFLWRRRQEKQEEV